MGQDMAHLAEAQALLQNVPAMKQQGQAQARALTHLNLASLCVSVGSNVKHHFFPAWQLSWQRLLTGGCCFLSDPGVTANNWPFSFWSDAASWFNFFPGCLWPLCCSQPWLFCCWGAQAFVLAQTMKSPCLLPFWLSIFEQEENRKPQKTIMNKKKWENTNFNGHKCIVLILLKHPGLSLMFAKLFRLPVKCILQWVFLGWKDETFHLTTVKIRLFNISKLTSFFRHYIPQNLLFTVKNSVNHYFSMAAKEEKFFCKMPC